MTNKFEKSDLIRKYVIKRIEEYQRLENTGIGKAKLAKLRRGIGKKPGDDPALWGEFLRDLSETLLKDDKAVNAVYTALTLYALHQQSNAENHERVFKKGMSLGKSVGAMIKSDDEEARMLTKFKALTSANNIYEMNMYLRNIIQLIKREGIPLDYSQLAVDIYRLQNPKEAPKVRLKWARDFYTATHNKTKDEEKEKDE